MGTHQRIQYWTLEDVFQLYELYNIAFCGFGLKQTNIQTSLYWPSWYTVYLTECPSPVFRVTQKDTNYGFPLIAVSANSQNKQKKKKNWGCACLTMFFIYGEKSPFAIPIKAQSWDRPSKYHFLQKNTQKIEFASNWVLFLAKSPQIPPILHIYRIGSVTETHPSIYLIS